MSRSEGSETAAAAFLDEGRRTIGVWLPLALADLCVAVVAPWLKEEERAKLTRSRLLASWALPMLSRSVEADEKEQEALAVYHQVQAMAAKQQAKEAAR